MRSGSMALMLALVGLVLAVVSDDSTIADTSTSTSESTIVSDDSPPVSPSIDSTAMSTDSSTETISPAGDFVCFSSQSSNLDNGVQGKYVDVFLKNLSTGEVWRVSQNQNGVPGKGGAISTQRTRPNCPQRRSQPTFHGNRRNTA